MSRSLKQYLPKSSPFPRYVNRNLFWFNVRSCGILADCFLSGNIIKGEELSILKKRILDKYQVPSLVLTDSGRVAISLFLRILREKYPDRNVVILPFFICPSVITAIKSAGYVIRYVGIGRDLNIDPNSITQEKLQNVAAVIVPHIYGYPADIKTVINKVKNIDPHVAIIDDAAAAFNVKIGNKFAGTYGDIGIISFSQGKLLNATGGGILLINNSSFIKSIKSYYQELPYMKLTDKLKEFLLVCWRYGMHRYSAALSYWLYKYGHFNYVPLQKAASRMANIDAVLAINVMDNIEFIHQRMLKIQEYYMRQFKKLSLPVYFPQMDTSRKQPVARLACVMGGDIGDIGNLPPADVIRKRLAEHGIKVYTSYGPINEVCQNYNKLWREHPILQFLIMLPVDYTKTLAWHANIIKKIDMGLRY